MYFIFFEKANTLNISLIIKLKFINIMKKLYLLLAFVLTTSLSFGQDLFFSEYIEGSSNNKALEIYNGTGASVNLDDYRIAQATNGNGWTFYHTFPTGATLADGATWTIITTNVDTALFTHSNADEVLAYPSVVHHNGDDARGLEKTMDGGATWTLIDLIGDPDNDPGSGWDKLMLHKTIL